jgi:hypothetical protein
LLPIAIESRTEPRGLRVIELRADLEGLLAQLRLTTLDRIDQCIELAGCAKALLCARAVSELYSFGAMTAAKFEAARVARKLLREDSNLHDVPSK